ncbi:hypothetical protein [uncultured Lacinutrix sp.]|uniref:hypothetical protein n=1 Tax=uncultured Lacinutrix sp. TaxID=574032 RepID=UPI002601DE4C|nr:hypothetical protein [uncultured Lacinutrix sp.]
MKQSIILLALVLTINLSAQDNSYKYYKHLVFRETPYSLIKGRIEIPKERTEKENHYKLTYDSSNNLILIEYLFGDKQINRRRAGIMDGFRNIYSKTAIKYVGNLEIRTFYNSKGVQCNNTMNVYKEVYEYNKEGEKIGVKFYDKTGDLTNNTWNIAEYTWKKTNDFDIIEKRKDKRGNYVSMRPYYYFMTTLYKYTEKGILISMNNIDENGNLINDFDDLTGIALDKAEYDENFNLIGFRFYNANQEPVIGSFLESAGGKIEYDENGNCIKYATININGDLMLSRGKAYDRYKFDVFGNNIEFAHYGINNKLVEYRGYTKTKFIYDSNKPFKKGKVKRSHLK